MRVCLGRSGIHQFEKDFISYGTDGGVGDDVLLHLSLKVISRSIDQLFMSRMSLNKNKSDTNSGDTIEHTRKH